MHIFKLLVCLLICTLAIEEINAMSRRDIGTFWHISDLHLDFYYSSEKENRNEVCPSSFESPALDPGAWGDYKCDSPIELIKSAAQAMRKFEAAPDFILWTGDDTLHTSDEQTYLSEILVLETVANITQLLKATFPSTVVLSALGNHDYHPKYQMPPRPNNIVSGIADLWADWMTTDQHAQFRKMGYGQRTVMGQNLKVVILNTNMWDKDNLNINGTGDPVNQFAWLEEQLKSSRQNKQQVFVIGHIGPGFFERVTGEGYYYPYYNERYVELVVKYSDVIAGQFFGHHHTDSFRVFSEPGTDAKVSALFYAPSVTPRIGSRDGSTNPSIRLFQYDRSTSTPLDYTQYYTDLSLANDNGQPDWIEEYSALKEYGLSELSPTELAEFAQRLRNAVHDCTNCDSDSELLQRYNLLNTVSYSHGVCDQLCQKRHVCAIMNLRESSYKQCMENSAYFKSDQILKVSFIVSLTLLLQLYIC